MSLGLPATIVGRLPGLNAAVGAIAEDAGTVMRESPRELAALNYAIEKRRPACADDPRFTADGALSTVDDEQMRSMCSRCAIRQPCDDYATAAQPPSGFWAGRKRAR